MRARGGRTAIAALARPEHPLCARVCLSEDFPTRRRFPILPPEEEPVGEEEVDMPPDES